jgi:hypothetical protein
VLDEGKVVARGTHAQLLTASPLYAAFAAEQSAKAELEAAEVDSQEVVA